MGRMSREKGKRFERQIAEQIRRAFPGATVHRSSQADRAYEADVVITDSAPDLLKQLWLELCDARAKDVQPLEKLAQAERDTRTQHAWRLPVVVWHVTGARTVHATMRLETLASIAGLSLLRAPARGVPVTMDWQQLLAILAAPTPEAQAA